MTSLSVIQKGKFIIISREMCILTQAILIRKIQGITIVPTKTQECKINIFVSNSEDDVWEVTARDYIEAYRVMNQIIDITSEAIR